MLQHHVPLAQPDTAAPETPSRPAVLVPTLRQGLACAPLVPLGKSVQQRPMLLRTAQEGRSPMVTNQLAHSVLQDTTAVPQIHLVSRVLKDTNVQTMAWMHQLNALLVNIRKTLNGLPVMIVHLEKNVQIPHKL